ncbi:AAA family ATPase [Thermoactinomyces mirandus]|uniref:AAA family ATPase n=1 Tax=Thermoactinomyces mirandus TaxID=2756294 RepID=A0A7W1XQ85_9BACL|nr:AAA family ATPase [Thermoactinomyces mirandus]MBA4601278.1 AAA family ATPase [Thermoactinomyces mirandus]
MYSDIKVLIVTEEAPIATDLQDRLSHQFSQITHIFASEVRREISRIQPDIVLLHEGADGIGMQLIPYISREVTHVEIIYLTESKDSIRIRDASRAGAFDVLFFPDEINAIVDVLSRAVKALKAVSARNRDIAEFTWGRGQVIAFYSGKGGAGKSLIASTLAQSLQLESSCSVLLVDLNLQYGGIETYLQLESNRNLYDLTPVLRELNDNHIRSVTVVEPYSQVEVLTSPADLEIAEQITEEHVERLLRAARLYYDYILVDLPSKMTDLTYTTLEEADKIYYLLTPDALSLRILNRVLGAFNMIGIDPTDRLQLLLNRVNRDSEIGAREIRQRFAFEIAGEFRDDLKKIDQAVNRGKPLRTVRNERNISPFAKDVQKFARMMLGKTKSIAAAKS